MSKWHALVIEDEIDSAEVLERVLSYHNISYSSVSSAEEALILIRDARPSVLIVDLALPGMDGWGLLRALRNDPETAHIPAVAVTAFHSVKVAQEAIRAGFKAYFSKPLDIATFVQELTRIIEPH